MPDMGPQPDSPPKFWDLETGSLVDIDPGLANAFHEAISAAAQHGPFRGAIKTEEEVRREATKRSKEIFTSYEFLHQILQRHETTIQKRWLKKTRSQRLKILLNAWPNMPLVHRPDFDAFHKESNAERMRKTKYQESYMFPYINQEDLLNTKSLPLLLNARGRHPPSNFATADIGAMLLGLRSGAIVPIVLSRHALVLNGIMENMQDYGQLLAMDDHPDVADWITKKKQFTPGEGLLVLRVQSRVLSFLIECCCQILHDIPQTTLISEAFPILPEPYLKCEKDINGFESLGTIAAEAPYRVPGQLDLGRIEALLSARASAAEDHLWTLREDPDYFAKELLDSKEPCVENLPDIYGKKHPMCRRGSEMMLWACTMRQVLSEAYFNLEYWSELSRLAKGLIVLHQKHAANIIPSKDLPEEYLAALLQLIYSIYRATRNTLELLEPKASGSPPLRRLYARISQPDPELMDTIVVAKPRSELKDVENRLTWALKTVSESQYHLTLPGILLGVDELERIIQSDPCVQKLISAHVARTVGDLSILCQCAKQLNSYQPWASSFEYEISVREDFLIEDYGKRIGPWGRMMVALVAAFPETRKPSEAVRLGHPSDGRFNYPIGKRRTKENVEMLRRAEGALDAFWVVFDKIMMSKAGNLGGCAVNKLLSQQRMLQRTREWIEPQKHDHATSAHDQRVKTDPYNVYRPISTVYSGLSARSLNITPSKAKIKTRGAPKVTPTRPLKETGAADRHLTFYVDDRALKVFRTVFFDPAVTSTPGEVPWNDFLHAMSSVGFTIMKLYGSVWQFQPTRPDIERKIQFHEPHPRGKLPFRTARRYGRRLNRAYGWIGEMFASDKK